MKTREFFTGLLNYKRQYGAADKTIKAYEKFLKWIDIAVGDIEVDQLKLTDVGKVLDVGRDHGRFGPQRAAVVYRQLLRYIRHAGIKFEFDWRDIQLPPEPRKKVEWLDKGEFELVRNSFDLTTLSGMRDRALVEILRVTGMRISEALSLNRDDINWDKKEAEITNAKTKEREIVYFTDESLAWLKRYLSMRNDRGEALFVSYNARRIQPEAVRKTIFNSTKNCGVKKRVHPHIFRSTFGTELLQGGVDIKSVQSLMRHKSERTTLKHYIAVSKDRCRDEHQRVLNGNVPFTAESLEKGFADLKEQKQAQPV